MDRKLNVYIMYLVVFLQGFVFYGPFATLYRQARGLSMYDIFLIESISMVLMLIFEIPWGWFADRFGYKRTIVISAVFFFISKVVFYEAYSFEMFLLERVFLALALAGLSGCDTALLYSSIEKQEAQRVFGNYGAFSTCGFLIASLLSAGIVRNSMDATAFWTIIPYGAAAALTLFLKDTAVRQDKKPKLRASMGAAFGSRHIILLILSVAIVREVVQSASVFLNQLQYVRSGIHIEYFGVLAAVMQIVRLSSAKAHVLSSRFGENRSLQVLYLVVAASSILLIFTENPAASVVCIASACAGMALLEPISLDIQNKAVVTGDRATILSIYAMLGDLVSILVNPLVGKAADISAAAAFEVCAVLCCIACVLLFLYGKGRKNVGHSMINCR